MALGKMYVAKPLSSGKKAKSTKKTLTAKQRREVSTIAKRTVRENQETKYFDVALASTGVSDAGTVTKLSSVTQGTSDITRIGDSLTLKSMQFRFNAIVADTTNIIRLAIIQWKGDDGDDAPVISDLLGTGSTYSPLVAWNVDNKPSYNILYDTIINLGTYNDQEVASVYLPLYKLPCSKHIQFHGGGITGNNHIYLVMVSDSGAVAHPTVQYYSRINFTDA